MNKDEFRHWSHRAADWAADYRESVAQRPVRAQTEPGDIASLIDASPPEEAQPMQRIFADFERIVPDGMTHWQHPRFFAYFPSNAAPAAVIAEQLAGAMAAQCMLWQTSPAATELEFDSFDAVQHLRSGRAPPRSAQGRRKSCAGVWPNSTICASISARSFSAIATPSSPSSCPSSYSIRR